MIVQTHLEIIAFVFHDLNMRGQLKLSVSLSLKLPTLSSMCDLEVTQVHRS